MSRKELDASVRHVVAFHDVDSMSIVWHGNYFKYFELARTAMARALRLDFPEVRDLGFGMPVIGADAKFRRPLLYGDEVLLKARIREPLLPALMIDYEIVSLDGATIYATGNTKQAYVSLETMETALSLPPAIEDRLRSAMATAP